MKRKSILIITSNFIPEPSGIALYSYDLARYLKDQGFAVTVLTGIPHYPWWRVPDQFSHILPGETNLEGINLWRIKHFIPTQTDVLSRGRFEFSFWRNGFRQLRHLRRNRFDLVVAVMPTVSSGILARSIAKKVNSPGVVIFQDLSSFGAIQSGLSGGLFVYHLVRILERKASIWAKKIIVISNEMSKSVSELVDSKVEIEIINNYTVSTVSPESISEARKKLGIPDNLFIVLHSGNIGFKQDLLNVVKASKGLEAEPNIQILIIGHGNQERVVDDAISGLTNIRRIPFVSAESYPSYLAAANVLLVNERSSLKEMSLPSKLTSYIPMGRPIIAAVSEQSATHSYVKDFGYLVEPGKPRLLSNAILNIYFDCNLQKVLSERTVKFSENHLSPNISRMKYKKLIDDII